MDIATHKSNVWVMSGAGHDTRHGLHESLEELRHLCHVVLMLRHMVGCLPDSFVGVPHRDLGSDECQIAGCRDCCRSLGLVAVLVHSRWQIGGRRREILQVRKRKRVRLRTNLQSGFRLCHHGELA